MSTAGGKSDHDLTGATDRERRLFARLDPALAGHRARLTPAQLHAIRTWQRSDRTYELIQAIARRRADPLDLRMKDAGALVELQRDLDLAIASSALPFPMTVYRGLRSLVKTFGMTRPEDLEARTLELDGYFATSVVRSVAVSEFTRSGGALMEVALSAGVPALWVAGAGSHSLRRQGELLLPDPQQISIRSVGWEGKLPLLSVEVIEP